MQPDLHSASGSPEKGSGQGKAAGIALASTSGCHPCQVLLPWARNRTEAEELCLHPHTPLPNPSSMQVVGMETPPCLHVADLDRGTWWSNSILLSPAAQQRKVAPTKKANSKTTTTPPPPKTVWTKKTGTNQITLTLISVINTICFHAALQILSFTTALQR